MHTFYCIPSLDNLYVSTMDANNRESFCLTWSNCARNCIARSENKYILQTQLVKKELYVHTYNNDDKIQISFSSKSCIACAAYCSEIQVMWSIFSNYCSHMSIILKTLVGQFFLLWIDKQWSKKSSINNVFL